MLLNTRILHYHFQDLLHSPTIQHADVIVLQETFLCPTDRNLDYQVISSDIDRLDQSRSQGRRHGGSVFMKKCINTICTNYFITVWWNRNYCRKFQWCHCSICVHTTNSKHFQTKWKIENCLRTMSTKSVKQSGCRGRFEWELATTFNWI